MIVPPLAVPLALPRLPAPLALAEAQLPSVVVVEVPSPFDEVLVSVVVLVMSPSADEVLELSVVPVAIELHDLDDPSPIAAEPPVTPGPSREADVEALELPFDTPPLFAPLLRSTKKA